MEEIWCVVALRGGVDGGSREEMGVVGRQIMSSVFVYDCLTRRLRVGDVGKGGNIEFYAIFVELNERKIFNI
jgi:hypothetical protein